MIAIQKFVASALTVEYEIQQQNKLDKIIKLKHDAIRMQQLSVFCYQNMLHAPDLFATAVDSLKSLAISNESNFYLRETALIKTLFLLFDLSPEEAYRQFEELSRLLSDYKDDQSTIQLHNDLVYLFNAIVFGYSAPANLFHTGRPNLFTIFWIYRILGGYENMVTSDLPDAVDRILHQRIQNNNETGIQAWNIYWLAKLADHFYQVEWTPLLQEFVNEVEKQENDFFIGGLQFAWVSFFKGETAFIEQAFATGTTAWMRAYANLNEPDKLNLITGTDLQSTDSNVYMLQPTLADKLKHLAEAGNYRLINQINESYKDADFFVFLPAVYRISTMLAGVFERKEQFELSWNWWEFASRLVDYKSNPKSLIKIEPISDSMEGLPGHSAFLYDHLRSRSHTHFLFNSLNSIHLAIYDLSVEQINSYLRQIRRIINYRFNTIFISSISLSEELQFLYDYLCLEQLRFKSRLVFDLKIDVNSDLRHIQIAPMVVQPLIENAIKHGIRNQENGKIDLTIKQMDRGFIKIVVQDNGIGRRKSAALKRESAEPQSEQGTRLLKFGFKMIQLIWGKTPSIKYADSDSGTCVTLKIPYKMNYV